MTEQLPPFKRWYEQGGREKVSQARKDKYANNPQYRQAAIDRSRGYRAAKKAEALGPKKEGYDISFPLASSALGVSPVVLRRWGERGYFPEPYWYGDRLFFTRKQLALLLPLAKFLLGCGGRITSTNQQEFNSITASIKEAW